MKSVKQPAGLKTSYQTSGYVPGRGSPSLKENNGNFAVNYLASLKNSTKAKNLKMGSPTSESHQRGYRGSPDISRPDNPLKMIQNKYLPAKTTHGDGSPSQERSNTPQIMQKLATQRRANGKKLSFSPSPSTGSPNDRENSVNKSFTEQGSPKPQSPPKFVQGLVASRGSPKLGGSGVTGSLSAALYHSGANSQSGVLAQPGSPSTQNAEYLLDASKHPPVLYKHEGVAVTFKCINHEDKRSTFYVVEDYRVKKYSEALPFKRGVCSRCAARLANLGFKTVDLYSEEEEERKKVLKSFLDKIEQTQAFHAKSYQSVEFKKNNLKKHYEGEFAALDEFESNVDRIIQILQQNKSEVRAFMESEYQKEYQKLADIQAVINANLNTINLIHHEASRNFDHLLLDSGANIKQAVKSYEEKMASFTRSTQQGNQAKALVIKFGRVPSESIFQIGSLINEWFKIDQQELVDTDEEPVNSPDLEASDDDEDSEQAYEESAKKSPKGGASQDEGKSLGHVCVSFDNKEIFESALAQGSGQTGSKGMAHVGDNSLESSTKANGQKYSTHKYISILDKISESQNEKNNYYNNLVRPKDRAEEGKDAESLFVITPHDEDFSMKQTPELGQKEEVPDFLREQIERMHSQLQANQMTKALKPTHVESLQEASTNSAHQKSKADSVQRSEMEELFSCIGQTGRDGDQAAYGPTKCQKILFNDKK